MIKEALAVVEQVDLSGTQPGGVKASTTTTGKLITSGIQIVFIFAGLAVLIFLVWGAFDWILSGGDKEKVAGARRKITNAIIGLFILSVAYFIATLVSDIAGIPILTTGIIPQLGQPTTTTTP